MERKLSELHNWDKNPRGVKKDDFNRLKKLILKLGIFKPFVITEDGTVLGGNMRLMATNELVREGQLDITEVPVTVVDAPDEKTKIEYALADNDRVGYYEDQELAELVQDIDIDLGDYKVDLGQPVSLDKLLEQFGPDIEEDEAPDVEEGEPDSKLGEVYQLGRHRLMCGDATKIEDVEKLMDGKKADMVFTDPPYGMFLDADFSDMKNNLNFAKDKGFVEGRKYDNVRGDHKDFNPDFINTIFAVFPEAKEVFMWGANYYTDLLQDKNKGSWFVWDKRLDESADKMYGSCFELCWSKNKHKQDIARVKWASVFGTEQEFDHKRHHPTQKPVRLSEWFISRYSKENDVVVDLFGGSGSTLIACEQTNRTCYMMELDPKYCDVIRKRYEQFTSRKQDGK